VVTPNGIAWVNWWVVMSVNFTIPEEKDKRAVNIPRPFLTRMEDSPANVLSSGKVSTWQTSIQFSFYGFEGGLTAGIQLWAIMPNFSTPGWRSYTGLAMLNAGKTYLRGHFGTKKITCGHGI